MRIPAHERLLDLIIALVRARPALTRAQIRRGVQGYRRQDRGPESDIAFERMFERDKDTLKKLGIPISTLHDHVHGDDVRYRIDLADYELPQVDLTPAELGVLSVATQLWEGSVLSRDARRGLTKLKGVTHAPAEGDFNALVHLQEPDESLPVLIDAISNAQPVRFTYTTASTGIESRRRVEPWRLRASNRAWYLHGFDLDKAESRVFRLSRITSVVMTIGAPGSLTTSPAPEETPAKTHRVRLAIRTDAAALLRARGDLAGTEDGRDLIELQVSDLTRFAEEVCAYGDSVLVREPTRLLDDVLARLRAVSHLADATRPALQTEEPT